MIIRHRCFRELMDERSWIHAVLKEQNGWVSARFFFPASVIRYLLLYRWIIQTYSTTSITYKFQIVHGCRSFIYRNGGYFFASGNLPFCVIKIVSNLGECCWGKIIVVQQHILQLISYFALWRGMYFQSTKWISVINNKKELFHPTMTTLFHN